MLIKKRLSNEHIASEGVAIVKDAELKLISELMKDSRRSDRELAKAVGVSQPTISRMIRKLEKEGIVKEYTMVPDFSKVGFEIMAVSFVKFSKAPSEKKVKELRSIAQKLQRNLALPTVMVMSGIGLGFDRIIVSLHKDYSSYSQFLTLSKELSTQALVKFESFLINLPDKNHYQHLTLAGLGEYMRPRTGK